MKVRKLTVPDAKFLVEALETNGELAAIVFGEPGRIYVREGDKLFAYDLNALREACIEQAKAA